MIKVPQELYSSVVDYVHPNDEIQPTFEMTPGFKPFTVLNWFVRKHVTFYNLNITGEMGHRKPMQYQVNLVSASTKQR